jgi:DNA-binding winged helix-turn-helix (wHTH) protein
VAASRSAARTQNVSTCREGVECTLNVPRYRFAGFVLSPRRRALIRGGRPLRLIPRYFDLLVFLVEHRHEAVHRRDIFDRVWSDVVVSDTALSQAIRTLRRVLGDDTRDPRYIRTVARHGYQFVCAPVIEEPDEGGWPPGEDGVTAGIVIAPAEADGRAVGGGADAFEPLLERLLLCPTTATEEEEQRDAAERLHALGTTEALKRLGRRTGHASARALLRDTRWDVASAGDVPIAGEPDALATVAALIRLRLRRVGRAARERAASAAAAGGIAGSIAGALGGLLLAAAPGGEAPLAVVPVLTILGFGCGAVGGAGVGSGLAVAESVARSSRFAALALGGALGGGMTGLLVEWLGRWTLATLVGLRLPIGGGLEGTILGAAAGLGYAAATRGIDGGLAAPRGGRRIRAAAITSLCCGAGALMIAALGRPLVGGTVHLIAQAAVGSKAALTPLGRLIGEPDFGRLTQIFIAAGEGCLFGFGVSFGLTRRPR